jgi:hypothetical protein
MRESQIEAHLVKRVKAAGGEVRKVQWIGRRGAPDRLVMLPAPIGQRRGFWVELKAPGQPLKPHQAREHARMKRMGESVFKVDTIEQVEALLA